MHQPPDYTQQIQLLEQSIQPDSIPDTISLMNGKGGLVLLYAYLYKSFGNEYYFHRYSDLLDECLALVSQKAVSDTFSGGLAGMMWLLRHLITMDLLSDENEELLDIWERQLIASLEKDITTRNYDFLHGLLGKSQYFLESYHKPVSHQILTQVVHLLKDWAVPVDGGIAWNDYHFDTTKQKAVLSLGMAHGIPSIIGFLAQVYAKDIERETVKELVEQSVGWLLNQQRQSGISRFPVMIGVKEESRLAWCYGDLGPIMAIFMAAKALGKTDWYQQAVILATVASNRTIHNADLGEDPQKGYLDGGFCHGMCGISHIFYRIYQHTGMTAFQDVSQYWLTQLLNNPANDPNGYIFPHGQDAHAWHVDSSLIIGTAGMIMTLLSQQKREYTHWDSAFMTSL